MSINTGNVVRFADRVVNFNDEYGQLGFSHILRTWDGQPLKHLVGE